MSLGLIDGIQINTPTSCRVIYFINCRTSTAFYYRDTVNNIQWIGTIESTYTRITGIVGLAVGLPPAEVTFTPAICPCIAKLRS